MVFLRIWKRLNDREFVWLDRRTQDKSGIGVPDDVRDKIIRLGLGVPEGLHSFRLTAKGEQYLKQHGRSRNQN